MLARAPARSSTVSLANPSKSLRNSRNYAVLNPQRIAPEKIGLIQRVRRDKIKATIKIPQDENTELLAFPYERLGDDYHVNWTLCRHGIVPTKEAYRNLHLQGLLNRIRQDKVDNKKKVVYRNSVADEPLSQYLQVAGKDLNNEQFGKFQTEFRRHLSESDVYMRDAAIGSHLVAETETRVVSDNPTTDYFLRNMMTGLPISAAPHFKHSLFVTAVSSIANSKLDDAVKSKRAVIAYSREKAQLLIGGNTTTKELRTALAFAVADRYLSQPALNILPLNCDSVVDANGNSTLIFNSNELFLSQLGQGLKLPGKLFGAHNHLWSLSGGLVRAWDGASFPCAAPVEKGSLIETLPNNVTRTTQSLHPTANVANHPTNIVFMINDTQGVLPTIGKLNSAEAAQFLFGGYNGSKFEPMYSNALKQVFHNINFEETASLFKKLIEENKTSVFLVNVAEKPGKLHKSDAIEKLFSSIMDGSAAKASSGGDFKILKAITSLPGFKTSEVNTTATGKFEEELISFVNTNFPKPPKPPAPTQ
mmetsp:Transcript_5308/g.7454  ORF Transcript_5308/g.7454 Transcript_5308/m.7454 type:complete len:533 (+) Transcript_5308:75-1673(+)